MTLAKTRQKLRRYKRN